LSFKFVYLRVAIVKVKLLIYITLIFVTRTIIMCLNIETVITFFSPFHMN